MWLVGSAKPKVGLMHDSPTSREMKKINSTHKTIKIKISAMPVDREKNSPELSAAEFFNLFELRPPLKNLYDNYSM